MRSRYFLYAVIFIIFIALLEYPPRTPVVTSGASPANTGWDGTSSLMSMLKSRGYRVYAVTDWCSVADSLSSLNSPVIAVFISPEEPYSSGEVRCVSKVLSWSMQRYGSASLLVADEGPYTDPILKALNVSVFIHYGVTLKSVKGDPYPLALLKVPGGPGAGTYKLYLDYAARLSVSDGAVVAGRTLKGDAIAAYVVRGGFKAYVISDGSIFINEVLGLSSAQYNYSGFANALFAWLGSPGKYVVLMESGKYTPPVNGLPNLITRALESLGAGSLSAIVTLLHPMVWFPLLHTLILMADNELRAVLALSVFARLASLAIGTLATIFLMRMAVSFGKVETDKALPQVSEVQVMVDTPVRREVIGKKLKLGKEDLVALYELVDSVLKKTIGKGLREPGVIQTLSSISGIDVRRVEKYVRDMNALYVKATRGGIRPLVLSWNRRVRSLIRESDEVLSKLGAALTKGEGVEKALRKV